MTDYYLEGATFGQAMANYRKKSGWNQEHVAYETGFTTGYVSSVETAAKKPSLRFVKGWCAFIECNEVEVALWHQYAARAHGWLI